jgi:hypothetical protein
MWRSMKMKRESSARGKQAVRSAASTKRAKKRPGTTEPSKASLREIPLAGNVSQRVQVRDQVVDLTRR